MLIYFTRFDVPTFKKKTNALLFALRKLTSFPSTPEVEQNLHLCSSINGASQFFEVLEL